MFSGLREHEMWSNLCIIGGKISFAPYIINIKELNNDSYD